MSALRQSSEWGMGRIKGLWSYLEFKVTSFFVVSSCIIQIIQRNLRVLSMPLSMMFLMAVHLGNIHSCLYSNQVI